MPNKRSSHTSPIILVIEKSYQYLSFKKNVKNTFALFLL